MITHTCNCEACKGVSFTAPEGFIAGTAKQVRDMTHNYAQMLRSPVFAPRLAAQGVKVA